MKSYGSRFAATTLCLVLAGMACHGSLIHAAEPENLAPLATASASSEFSDLYLARFAVDGKIPGAGSGAADQGTAWCVNKAQSGDQGRFTLVWKQPVDLAEIIYWGRTAWFITECWKDYEVYLDDGKDPIVSGSLEKVHGPQSIKIPPTKVGKLTIKFLNSHGGPNPGVTEIQVFGQALTNRQLVELAKKSGPLASMPWIDRAEPAHVRRLIDDLAAVHGPAYSQASDHASRLDALERDAQATDDEDALDRIHESLAQLQRDVLLFDVNKLVVIKRHEITASHVYTYHYEGFQPGGGLDVISATDPQSEPLTLVESPTGQILDFDLSYDGRVVLFSWRQTEDAGYHLWTVNVDGSGLKQLTDGVWHDYNACWLPDGDIAFLTTRAPQFAYCWHAPVGILHRMSPDGSNPRKLSANYLNDFTPAVLDDGRIIYSRWEYVDRPAIPIQSMWTLNPDGTGLSVYFGNRALSPGTFMEARSIPGTSKVVCTMTGHNGPTRGAIGVIDRARGVNAQAAIENITPDVPVPNVDQGNGNTDGSKQYSCPCPLDRERFLVSIRGPLLVRTFSGECQSLVLDSPDDGMQYLNARPIRSRPRPPVISPGPLAKADPWATVFLQDVYNGLGPFVERGEVTHVRVVREMQKTVRIDPSLRAFGFQFPVISCGATYAGKTVLGDVPVNPDGSVAFRVPAEIPLYFMALDSQGRAVQRMRSFTHFMPGEVQGCIGCHDHRRRASPPDPRFVFSSPPVELMPPEWGVGGFDYSRIVQPVLDEHCIECHNPIDHDRGIDLTGDKTDFFNVSYDVLARENQGRRGSPYVNWIPTYNGHEQNILEVQPRTWGSYQSVLAQVVATGHPDENGQPRVDLDDDSRRRIFAWIDLNVPYYGSSETAYPDATGCRQILPVDLEKVLSEVAAGRCVECHAEGKFPRRAWLRITRPELNGFLLAPLSKAAGGTEKCGRAVFETTDDPDYQSILAAFDPIQRMLERTPRMDMPGGHPAADVCRDCR